VGVVPVAVIGTFLLGTFLSSKQYAVVLNTPISSLVGTFSSNEFKFI